MKWIQHVFLALTASSVLLASCSSTRHFGPGKSAGGSNVWVKREPEVFERQFGPGKSAGGSNVWVKREPEVYHSVVERQFGPGKSAGGSNVWVKRELSSDASVFPVSSHAK
ncbi:hypothetical protein BT96DRAFT_951342 [Gymnopus androsaceus JB14]|uniref:Uncharacterized protein n=1 Tax=Gymnopus androsaceus JB14 TaxID=1447944 RepID=A0A6A4GDF2_9AGAR|nr:hypothetical protein BT96DRAFT_951342 [Gymnopus androsaceus JB14]